MASAPVRRYRDIRLLLGVAEPCRSDPRPSGLLRTGVFVPHSCKRLQGRSTPLCCGHEARGAAHAEAPAESPPERLATRPRRQRPVRAPVRASGPPSSTWRAVPGVSYSTVSRVVNGYAHVKRPPAARVQAAMAELGYVAHVTARALASGRTQAIGLLAQEIDNPFFSVVIKGVDQEVSHGRLRPAAVHDPQPPREGGRVRRAPVARHGRRPAHRAAHRRCRSTSSSCAPSATRSCSSTTTATRPAATWSTPPTGRAPARASPTSSRSGHRRIGFITGRPDVGRHPRALRGLPGRAGARRASRSTTSSWSRATSWRQRGYAAAHELLALPRPPTAIFASSDAAAFGVLGRGPRRRPAGARATCRCSASTTSWRPPMSAPRLSTVRQPLREMGRVAVQRLMRLLADPSQPPAHRHGDRHRSTAPPSTRTACGGRRARPALMATVIARWVASLLISTGAASGGRPRTPRAPASDHDAAVDGHREALRGAHEAELHHCSLASG